LSVSGTLIDYLNGFADIRGNPSHYKQALYALQKKSSIYNPSYQCKRKGKTMGQKHNYAIFQDMLVHSTMHANTRIWHFYISNNRHVPTDQQQKQASPSAAEGSPGF
jgi:hypothetical protein